MRTPRDEQDGLAPLFRVHGNAATPEGEETSSLRQRQRTVVRNIVASAFVTARAEYLAAKPVGIILVGGVIAEINYVQDEIPGPTDCDNWERFVDYPPWGLGLSLLASRVLRLDYPTLHLKIKLAENAHRVRNRAKWWAKCWIRQNRERDGMKL